MAMLKRYSAGNKLRKEVFASKNCKGFTSYFVLYLDQKQYEISKIILNEISFEIWNSFGV